MATLRHRVYKRVGPTTQLIPLVRGQQITELTTGSETPETLKVVQYGERVTTQGLLDFIADLINNDQSIDTETNGINQLINEGVFNLQDYLFDITVSTSPTNKVTIGPGKGKFDDQGYANIFYIADDTELSVPSITHIGWYRRDLVSIVFKDTNNPTLVPYIEYTPGAEEDGITPRHFWFDKVLTTEKASYPLYSILWRNLGGTTTYIEKDTVYNLAGFKETVHFVQTQAYKRTDDGYYASPTQYRTFTYPDGTPLDPEVGSSQLQQDITGTEYDIEDVCSDDPTGKLEFAEPDIEFRDDLAHGDLLTFPFIIEKFIDVFSSATDIEMREFKIALDRSTVPEEGIDINLFTAKYFVDSANVGIIDISTVSVSGVETTLGLSKDITTFSKLTADQINFTTPSGNVAADDFIFVFYGKGLYQISKIISILGPTSIKISTLPITLNTTSKILIFKNSTVEAIGETIDSTFLSTKTKAEQIDYETQYPVSTNTGISSLKYDDTDDKAALTYGTVSFASVGHDWATNPQTFKINVRVGGSWEGEQTVTLNANCANITAIISHINTQLVAAGVTSAIAYNAYFGYVGIKTNALGSTESIQLTAGTSDALATMGITAGLYNGLDNYKPDLAYYIGLPDNATNKLFYHMPDPPATFGGHHKATFTFKIRLNFNQWYFARISMLDRGVPYYMYGIRPKVVVLDPTWASTGSDSLNGYLSTLMRTDAGQYPLVVDGDVIFKIEDAYGDIGTVSSARLAAGYPSSYRLESRFLGGVAFDKPADPDVAYVDVLNGLVSFFDASTSEPQLLFLTYYYNSIISGKLDTEKIIHESQATSASKINLWYVIEYLLDPVTGQPRYGKPYEYIFTGTAGQTTFTLPIIVGSKENMFVFVQGVLQAKDTYTLSDYDIILNTGLLFTGDKVVVKVGVVDLPPDIRWNTPWEENFVATAGQTQFTLTHIPDSKVTMSLYVSGAFQPQTHFTLSVDGIITLTDPLIGGETVTVKSWLPSGSIVPSLGSVTPAHLNGVGLIHLEDTPTNYTGAANKFLRVNSTADAVEFVSGNTIENFTANDILGEQESGKTCTNSGAAGAIELTLPDAAAGLEFIFIVNAAQYLRINAVTGDTIRNAATVSIAGGYIRANTVGNVLRLIAINDTQWITTSIIGTWTIDS